MTILKHAQLDALVLQMKQDYQTLLAEIRDELEHSGEQHRIDLLNREPGDSGDESFANALSDINVAQLDRHVEAIRDIEAAMTRVRNSEYGVCIDCGDPISFARLQAYPTAKRCIACQTKREKQYASQDHPSL